MHVLNTIPRVIYGPGAITGAGAEMKRLGREKAFIVTDQGIASLNLHEPLQSSLEQAGIACSVFSEAELEPSVHSIQRCADAAKAFSADCMIGIGGGSALDTAKAALALLTNPDGIERYFGMQLLPNPCLPAMLIPTAAGTGSEMTSISVLSNPATGAKQGVVSDYLYAKVVLLDPELTLGLPPQVTATTGMDAFAHALESYVSNASTPVTDAFNLQALRLIAGNLRKAYAHGGNLEARTAMLYAAALAGMGFSQTQNGIIHAMAMSLPYACKLPHGLAVAALLPLGMSYNCIAVPEKYAVVAEIMGVSPLPTALETARAGIEAVRGLLADLHIIPGLAAHGVPRDGLEGTAQRAAAAKRLMDNNPRRATAAQIMALLEENY